MLPEQFREQHDIYLKEWMRAEEVLKITERIKNETFIPSIKELRYASRRVVQADIDFNNKLAIEEAVRAHLTEAIENCRKARHDAIDSATNYIHEQLDKLSEQVGLAVLCQAFPNYASLRKTIKAIDERIVASRKDRCCLDDEYEKIKRDHLLKAVDLYHELECSEDAIKAIQKKQRKDFVLGIVGVGLVVGLIASGAILVADKKGYFDWAASAKTQSENHAGSGK